MSQGRKIVCGDVHGNIKALEQCLDRSGFDKEKDELICLGDIADGAPYVKECVDLLLTIPSLDVVRGNHDQWFIEHLYKGKKKDIWIAHGGYNTLKSYGIWDGTGIIPDSHREFFLNTSWFIDVETKEKHSMLFVHGGFDRHASIFDQPLEVLIWDRDLWASAMANEARSEVSKEKYPFKMEDKYDKIFIGHTTTQLWGKTRPMFASGIWNLDTGAGHTGKLTFMDVDTEEYWQSDTVEELYGKTFR